MISCSEEFHLMVLRIKCNVLILERLNCDILDLQMKRIIISLLFLIGIEGLAQIDMDHLKMGDQAPPIDAIDQHGRRIISDDILSDRRILLIFYRGNWCSHCKKHLSALQERLDQFNGKGVFVLVVSPETLEKTKETAQKFQTDFSIVHDTDNTIMENYKVAFDVNKENVTKYYEFVNQRIAEYNEENNNVLPVPATYLIEKDGSISFVHYDPDYKKRSDLDEILKML